MPRPNERTQVDWARRRMQATSDFSWAPVADQTARAPGATFETLTTVVDSTVDPGRLTKSTTSWYDFAALLGFLTVPVNTHFPDSWVQEPVVTSALALSAGLNGTEEPGETTTAPGGGGDEVEQPANSNAAAPKAPAASPAGPSLMVQGRTRPALNVSASHV